MVAMATSDPVQGLKPEQLMTQQMQEKIEEKMSTELTPESSHRPISSSGQSSADEVHNEKQKKRFSAFLRNPRNSKRLSTLDMDVQEKDVVQDPLKDLPQQERDIIERQIAVPDVKVGYFRLYRYATPLDYLFLAISVLCSIAGGAAMPLMTIIFGQLTGTFQNYFLGATSRAQFNSDLGSFTLYFIYLAIGEFITIYISTIGFIYVGSNITSKIRENYLRAILRQNIGFFDKLGAGEITTRITADTNQIQDGISEKVGLTLTALATFVTAFVIGFIKNWKLTLILSSTVVSIVCIMGFGSIFMIKYSKIGLESYALGGTIADEVFTSIRNTTAFSTQAKLAKQYDKHLAVAQVAGSRSRVSLGFMIGGLMGVIYLNYGLSFWEGSRLLVAGEITLSSVIVIMMSIMIGAFSLGNVAPNTQAFTTAVSAAAKIYSTIDRVSPLDPGSAAGMKLTQVEGTIELRNIKMIYPSRPEVTVMNDVSLVVPAGKVTALVGASGSGKSTIVGLVERFYDPVGGSVYLDGHYLPDLNLQWLRQQISLVSQEPVLFGTSIFNNIAQGLIGTSDETADMKRKTMLIETAAKLANAHDFVSSLPEGYETNVGERGFLLSGGQKQRIAIARAVVSDPKILLLDEATSALDTKSEGVVQEALDAAAKGRTTITIAHRLSTIKGADNIVVMSEGRIVEQGNHNDLIERKAAYYNLVEAQRIAAINEEKQAADGAAEMAQIEKTESQLYRNPTIEQIDASEDPDDFSLAAKLKRSQTGQSLSSRVLKAKSTEKVKDYDLWTLIKLVADFNKEERGLMIIGLIASVICGGGNPTQAVFMAKAITAMSRPTTEYNQLRSEINFWSLMYLMLAIVQIIAFSIQGTVFAICAERLIRRARIRAFQSILRQEIAYFDREENSAGALTSFLSTETVHIAGISGVTLGTLLVVGITLVAALSLGIGIGWKLGLVVTATVPVLLTCGFLRFWMLVQFQQKSKKAYEQSASYASEAVSAIRTVASLTREDDVWQHYHKGLVAQGRKNLISVLKSSILYASSQSLVFLCMALGFWYGGTLIAAGEYGMFQFFVVFSAIIFGAQSAGTIFSFAPDMGKARHAASQLKALYDRKPEIDSWSTEGEDVPDMKGSIEFRDVHFRYPTRPEQPVLRGLNLTVKPGQYIALVGPSGCGKSTTIAMMERFYDPLAGGVYVDGKEISSLNINQYRSYLALVSQEPTLYQGTIRDNVLMGSDNDATTTQADIEQACKDANIYNFIISLPDGFNTTVGSKGTLLSGGQKQRIAIARALLRNPKILLLDEATSALDSESEKVVQHALDQAAKGRTTIAVAHRLSTIQKADMIYVFDNGRVVESGTHNELMKKGGKYAELVQMQGLGKQ